MPKTDQPPHVKLNFVLCENCARLQPIKKNYDETFSDKIATMYRLRKANVIKHSNGKDKYVVEVTKISVLRHLSVS